MLSRLAGREHRVYTAICLLCRGRGFRDLGTEAAQVRFRPSRRRRSRPTPHEGSATTRLGAYAAQGAGVLLIDRVAGSFSNVVGLPVTRVVAMLARARLIRVTRSGPATVRVRGWAR